MGDEQLSKSGAILTRYGQNDYKIWSGIHDMINLFYYLHSNEKKNSSNHSILFFSGDYSLKIKIRMFFTYYIYMIVFMWMSLKQK